MISEKESDKIQLNLVAFCRGGDYRTRICDLLRVKIRRNENRVFFAPFGAESSEKLNG